MSLAGFASLIGEAIGTGAAVAAAAEPGEQPFTDAEQREVEERLRGLGYLE
jgi:hypothetical protein